MILEYRDGGVGTEQGRVQGRVQGREQGRERVEGLGVVVPAAASTDDRCLRSQYCRHLPSPTPMGTSSFTRSNR